jgi:hypothetical protein
MSKWPPPNFPGKEDQLAHRYGPSRSFFYDSAPSQYLDDPVPMALQIPYKHLISIALVGTTSGVTIYQQ